MGSNSSLELSPEEEKINDKIVEFEDRGEFTETRNKMDKFYREQFEKAYASYIAKKINEPLDIVRSVLVKNWEYNGQ